MKIIAIPLGNYKYRIECHDDILVAKAKFGIHEDGSIFLDHIDTTKGFERRGYATAILDVLKSNTHMIQCTLRQLDEKTINFYRKNGFVITGRRGVWMR